MERIIPNFLLPLHLRHQARKNAGSDAQIVKPSLGPVMVESHTAIARDAEVLWRPWNCF